MLSGCERKHIVCLMFPRDMEPGLSFTRNTLGLILDRCKVIIIKRSVLKFETLQISINKVNVLKEHL